MGSNAARRDAIFCVSQNTTAIFCGPVQTQYFASLRYAIVETQNIASVPHAMAAAMNRGFPTFVF